MRARLAFVLACAACGSFGTDSASPNADAGTADGGGGPTNPNDAGPLPSTDAGSCAPGFCDDFENRVDVQGPWDSLTTHADAVTLQVIKGAPNGQQIVSFAVSPKSVPPPEATTHGRLSHAFNLGASNTIALQFHFRAPTFGDAAHANLATVFTQASPPLSVAIYVTKDEIIASTSYDGANYGPIGTHARRINAWDTVQLFIDMNAQAVSVAVEDGDVVKNAHVSPGPAEGHAAVDLGPSYSDVQTSYTIDFDAFELRTP